MTLYPNTIITLVYVTGTVYAPCCRNWIFVHRR